jgi:voltage-gated potassium channel
LGVVHFTGYPDKKECLEAVKIREAAVVIVLARDEDDVTSDALTFDILHRIQEAGAEDVMIIAECVDDENRERFFNAGANIVLRPVRAYPEILVRTIVAPGSEKILENLFTHGGDHPRRYDVAINDITWAEVVNRTVNAGYGTPLAYIDTNGEPICNADPNHKITANAIIVMVREFNVPSTAQISDLLV